MAIRKRDMIQDAIRRYLEGRLFVYFDQLEKKEQMHQTFQSHMLRLVDAIQRIISTQQANHWIERVDSLAQADWRHKGIIGIKKEISEVFDDDFFGLFDEIEMGDILSIGTVIDALTPDIAMEGAEEIAQSAKIESYLEQFASQNPSAEHENYKD